MKWFLAALWILMLGAAFGLGHHLAVGDAPPPTTAPLGVEGRLADALRDRDMLTRTYHFAESLQELDERSIEAAVAVLEAQRLGVTEGEVRLFMLAWCRFDPAGAFAWADAWPGPWRSTLARTALFAWAVRDPEGAVEAFGGMEPARREELRASLISGWARSGDRAGLTKFLFSRPAGPERSRFLGVLLAELMQDGPDAITSWAEGVPVDAPNQAKVTAFLTAGGALAQHDPGDGSRVRGTRLAARTSDHHAGRAAESRAVRPHLNQ